MENKVESPDYQMDISEAGTTTADNISTSSASPTISNQAENGSSNGIDTIVDTVTRNMNSILLTSSIKNHDTENVENRNTLTLDTNPQSHQNQAQKLTPVHHHPLMMLEDDNESEESCNNSHFESNFPDVVPAHHQPLRLAQPATKSNATADLVNSVNNNIAAKSRKPMYREPSPVSRLNVS